MREKKIEIRDIRSGEFLWMKKKVLPYINDRAGVNGVTVYVWLCFYANAHTSSCFPSMELLAEHIGKSSDTARRTIKDLEAIGAIRIERVEGVVNKYFLIDIDPNEASAAIQVEPPGTPCTHARGSTGARGPLAPMRGVPPAPLQGVVEQDLIEQDLSNKKDSSGVAAGPSKTVIKTPYPDPTDQELERLKELADKCRPQVNVYMFMEVCKKACGYPPPASVMIKACESLLKTAAVKSPWGFLVKVVKAEAGQFFANLNIQEHQQFKREPANLGQIFAGMQAHGFAVS